MFGNDLDRAAYIQWQADKREIGFGGLYDPQREAEIQDALWEYPELRDMDDALNGVDLPPDYFT